MTHRRLTTIHGNQQRLDGGAMFGNAPKALWTRWADVDELNRIPLACRALLVVETLADGGTRNILLETGIGTFFEPKLRDRFGVVETEHMLLHNLQQVGLTDADIDIVILSHLHFDHAGGLLSPWQEGAEPTLLFPNATFVVGAEHWERAQSPHFRDRASFLPALNQQLAESGRLVLVHGETCEVLGDGWRFHRSNGHTPGLLLAEVDMPDGPIVFAADLIPGTPWVHLPITMGYDRYPEQLIDEKQSLLGDLLERNGRLYFTHDPNTAMSRIQRDQRGRFTAVDLIPHLDGLTQ